MLVPSRRGKYRRSGSSSSEKAVPKVITVRTTGIIPNSASTVAGIITKPAGAGEILSYSYSLIGDNGWLLGQSYDNGDPNSQNASLAVNENTLEGYWSSISPDMQGKGYRLTVVWTKL